MGYITILSPRERSLSQDRLLLILDVAGNVVYIKVHPKEIEMKTMKEINLELAAEEAEAARLEEEEIDKIIANSMRPCAASEYHDHVRRVLNAE